MRQLRARAQNPYSPSRSVSPFQPPITGHSQLVSLSLPPPASPFIPRVLPSTLSRSRISYPLLPRPSSFPSSSSWLTVLLLFRQYQSLPLVLLFPAPALTRELLSLFMQLSIVVVVFRLTPHHSFSITRSVLNARCVSRLSSSFHSSRATPRDRASIHPPDFSLFRSLFLPTSLSLSFPRSTVVSFIHLPSPHDFTHLHHISNLTRILSAAVSQTLKSFLGNWIECHSHPRFCLFDGLSRSPTRFVFSAFLRYFRGWPRLLSSLLLVSFLFLPFWPLLSRLSSMQSVFVFRRHSLPKSFRETDCLAVKRQFIC